jgi:DNA-binding Lrp family transcriptional regulator
MARPDEALDRADRRLLNLLQAAFPLVAHPFKALGEKLDISEEEAISRVGRLKSIRMVRQISAIFDSRRLGYESALAAMKVPPERLSEAAEIVNGHPGVSHNYAREHEYNLWFTIAVPPGKSVEQEVAKLREQAKPEKTLLLPALKVFKIGLDLDMTGEQELSAPGTPLRDRSCPGHCRAPRLHRGAERRAWASPPYKAPSTATAQNGTAPESRATAESSAVREETCATAQAEAVPLTPEQIETIKELQEDLPLEPRPFLGAADKLGISEEELLERGRDFIRTGAMRRFGAVLHHREAGFAANAMAVWAAPPERIDEAGAKMATFRAVSHCCQRPTYDDWPYGLFAMIHGRTREECQRIAEGISRQTGLSDYALIFSTKEYKKERVRYFTQDC